MQDPHNIGAPDPAWQLARLISNEFNVSVTADDVARVIRDRWATISALAHAVHDGRNRLRYNR